MQSLYSTELIMEDCQVFLNIRRNQIAICTTLHKEPYPYHFSNFPLPLSTYSYLGPSTLPRPTSVGWGAGSIHQIPGYFKWRTPSSIITIKSASLSPLDTTSWCIWTGSHGTPFATQVMGLRHIVRFTGQRCRTQENAKLRRRLMNEEIPTNAADD